MIKPAPHLFADFTAKLEDLHAVAVEGQRRDNAHDMQMALHSHLRTGVAALNGILRAITNTLDGSVHDALPSD